MNPERTSAEKSKSPQITETEKLASTITAPCSLETSILTHFQQLNLLRQGEQLLKKFQLAHFIVQNNLAFMKYVKFAHFEKEFHKVDLGVGFLNDKSCHEIIIFSSNSTIRENVVKPLNEKNGTNLVYYVMVLCQQQQTMKKNSVLSKHAKAGSRGLMFFRYNNQTILVPQECILVLKILSEVPIFLLNEENAWLV